MTDPLDILFENLLDHLDENLPSACWPLYQQESRLEDALLAALTPEQTELLEAPIRPPRGAIQSRKSAFSSAPASAWPGSCHSSPAGFFAFDATVFLAAAFFVVVLDTVLAVVSFLAVVFFAAVLDAAGFLAAVFFAVVLAVPAFLAAAARLAGFFSAVGSAAAASASSALSAVFFRG